MLMARNAWLEPENTAKTNMSARNVIDQQGLQRGSSNESRFMGQIKHVGAYADATPRSGDVQKTYKMQAYISEVDSELQPLPASIAAGIIANKIKNLPAEIDKRLIDFNANSPDISFCQSYLLGAGSELLDTNLGAKPIAIGNFGIAGNAQMCKNFYVAADNALGLVPFNADQGTFNAACQTQVSSATFGNTPIMDIMDDIIKILRDMSFTGITMDGVKGGGGTFYATCVLEPDLVNIMKKAIETTRKYTEVRVVLKNNPLFQSSLFVYRDIIFIPHDQVKRFRINPNDDTTNPGRLTFGEDIHAERGVLEGYESVLNDPVYSLTPVAFLSSGAVKCTRREGLRTITVTAPDKKSHAVYTRNQYGMNRTEYWNDDISDNTPAACINKSSLVAILPRNPAVN
jgi:hypothetical protein